MADAPVDQEDLTGHRKWTMAQLAELAGEEAVRIRTVQAVLVEQGLALAPDPAQIHKADGFDAIHSFFLKMAPYAQEIRDVVRYRARNKR